MVNKQLPISVIVLTYNEEANIGPCLDTIVDWAHEVFVVDSDSTDRTVEIATKYNAKIFQHPFETYSRKRNWAQANLPIANEWVCHIDADERVSPAMVAELRKCFGDKPMDPKIRGLVVRRLIVFEGRQIKHGGIYPSYTCRIFKRQFGRCEDREYDQHFLVDGDTLTLEVDLLEMTATSLFLWTARHNQWAQLEAGQLLSGSREQHPHSVQPKLIGTPIERRRWLRYRLYGNSPPFLRAFLYFIARYLFRGGFLDGIPGLIYHVLHGFWFRFYVDACCYELRKRENQGFKQEFATKTAEQQKQRPALHARNK
jgi:glycosyltransferase involved in cell wall biosynthesis